MLLLALPHLPCGYTLPANCLLVKSNDKLPLVRTICCHSFIFPVTFTRNSAVTFQATTSERQHVFLEVAIWQEGPEHPFHLRQVGIWDESWIVWLKQWVWYTSQSYWVSHILRVISNSVGFTLHSIPSLQSYWCSTLCWCHCCRQWYVRKGHRHDVSLSSYSITLKISDLSIKEKIWDIQQMSRDYKRRRRLFIYIHWRGWGRIAVMQE